jgi:hypothetical protein
LEESGKCERDRDSVFRSSDSIPAVVLVTKEHCSASSDDGGEAGMMLWVENFEFVHFHVCGALRRVQPSLRRVESDLLDGRVKRQYCGRRVGTAIR